MGEFEQVRWGRGEIRFVKSKGTCRLEIVNFYQNGNLVVVIYFLSTHHQISRGEVVL